MLSSPVCKNIPIYRIAKSPLYPLPSRPTKGRSRDRHETRGGMRWTLRALQTTSAQGGRRSRVVPTPRRWCQIGGAIRRRRWQTSPVTGESAKETVKTIVQETPGKPGEPVVTTLVCFLSFAREAAGATAPGVSCALCLLEGQGIHLQPRTHRAARTRPHVRRHCEKCLRRSTVNSPPSTRIARGGEGLGVGGSAAFTEAAVPADRPPTPNPSPPLRGRRGEVAFAV